MTKAKPYPHYTATSGAVTVCAARKDGITSSLLFCINAAEPGCRRRWVTFNPRALASRADLPAPVLMTAEEIWHSTRHGYTGLLRRDLQRVADWCAEHGILQRLTA